MTCGFITINKTKQKQANVYSGGRWKLINSAGEPVHKWLYWNPRNSRSGHQLMSPTTWVIIFNWSPHFQLQNTKLNLSDFTANSSFNRETNYKCIDWLLLWDKQIKTKKIAKLIIKKPEKQNCYYYYYHYYYCYYHFCYYHYY